MIQLSLSWIIMFKVR